MAVIFYLYFVVTLKGSDYAKCTLSHEVPIITRPFLGNVFLVITANFFVGLSSKRRNERSKECMNYSHLGLSRLVHAEKCVAYKKVCLPGFC